MVLRESDSEFFTVPAVSDKVLLGKTVYCAVRIRNVQISVEIGSHALRRAVICMNSGRIVSDCAVNGIARHKISVAEHAGKSSDLRLPYAAERKIFLSVATGIHAEIGRGYGDQVAVRRNKFGNKIACDNSIFVGAEIVYADALCRCIGSDENVACAYGIGRFGKTVYGRGGRGDFVSRRFQCAAFYVKFQNGIVADRIQAVSVRCHRGITLFLNQHGARRSGKIVAVNAACQRLFFPVVIDRIVE